MGGNCWDGGREEKRGGWFGERGGRRRPVLRGTWICMDMPGWSRPYLGTLIYLTFSSFAASNALRSGHGSNKSHAMISVIFHGDCGGREVARVDIIWFSPQPATSV